MKIEHIYAHVDFEPLNAIEGIQVDLRYAGAQNFVNQSIYGKLDCAWLHRQAAAGVRQAVRWLAQENPHVSLLILDALRPHRAQEMLWEQLKGTDLQRYLASPARGSIHSFGLAVDVTLVDESGVELDMGTEFDAMTLLSHPEFEQLYLQQGRLTEQHIANRTLLRGAMFHSGFKGINTEWWHFDFGDAQWIRQHYERID